MKTSFLLIRQAMSDAGIKNAREVHNLILEAAENNPEQEVIAYNAVTAAVNRSGSSMMVSTLELILSVLNKEITIKQKKDPQ